MKKITGLQYHALAGATIWLLAGAAPAIAMDLLATDDFSFDSSAMEVSERSWTDGFKTSLAHSHTQIPAQPSREQSSLRIEYEGNIAGGWYLKLDTRYRYFWEKDDLAERRGGAYGHNKWQRAWVQYSRSSCTATAGRQTLIWGTVEGTFVTDIVTPFDYTEQLLTDYGNVRLAQDMLVGECFFSGSQLQAFYTPEARTDIFQHHRLKLELAPGFPPVDLSVDAEEEWGLRYKWLGKGYDVSVMLARLYDNVLTPLIRLDSASSIALAGLTPAIGLNQVLVASTGSSAFTPKFSIEPELAQFDLAGIASSLAVGRLLLKFETAYRSEQLIAFSDEVSERFDAALGFEYTTSTNHLLNAGIWGTHFKNDTVESQDTQVFTLGWRKTFLNDNLIMSLLGNWASSPRFSSATILADYRWSDYWSSSLALSIADLGELGANNPIAPAEESATVSIQYEF